MCDEPVELTKAPRLADVNTMEQLLCSMGVEVQHQRSRLRIDPGTLRWEMAPYDIVRKMRASFFVLAPLLARHRKAQVSLPGGCAIGIRPVNFHLQALTQMGADLRTEHGFVVAESKRLKGSRIRFPIPSVGATETALCAAVLARGKTVIENAAREPEVQDLARFLNSVGAEIEGIGTATLEIKGVRHLGGGTHRIMPDRIEAGTYLVAGAMVGKKIEVSGCPPDLNEALLDHLEAAGAKVTRRRTKVLIERNTPIRPIKLVETNGYPGFPTDLQAQLMALLTLAEGTSVIKENIFENRFMHVSELCRMGADIFLQGNTATVHGVGGLSGASVMASDLRASAALILAGLAAQGTTEVLRVYHLDRGYEAIEKKLTRLGGRVVREKGPRPRDDQRENGEEDRG
jgi:UDP-N-acetylglucosamine 1-carboxyvinyltransferase